MTQLGALWLLTYCMIDQSGVVAWSTVVARGRSPKTATAFMRAAYVKAADGLQCRDAILRG